MVKASWGQGSWWWSVAAVDERKKKSGADSYVDQFFGDGLFEVNTWTNKPTMMYHSNI